MTKDIYEESKSDQFLEESIKSFSPEIEKLVIIANKICNWIWYIERCNIWIWALSKSWPNVLKVYKTDSDTLGKLNMYVQVHNLAQEEMVDVATMVLEYQAQKTYQLYHKDMSLS